MYPPGRHFRCLIPIWGLHGMREWCDVVEKEGTTEASRDVHVIGVARRIQEREAKKGFD